MAHQQKAIQCHKWSLRTELLMELHLRATGHHLQCYLPHDTLNIVP